MNETDVLRVGAAMKALLVEAGVPSGTIYAQVVPEGVQLGDVFYTYKHLKTVFDYTKPAGAVSNTAVVQVNAWGRSADKASEAGRVCLEAVQEHRGEIAELEIQQIRLRDAYDAMDEESAEPYFAKSLVFEIVFQ
jgi:hypothetical protein